MTQKVKTLRPKQIAAIGLDGCLTTDEVCRIHQQLCDDFAATEDPIDPPGVRSEHLLASAVGRQDTGWGPQLKYPKAVANAATLTFGLCNDHPFHNGNKRTALVAMLAHLDRNRLTLHSTKQAELFELILDVAQTQFSLRRIPARSRRSQIRPTPDAEVDALTEWLCSRTQPVVRGERDMTYRQLGQILKGFGYELGTQNNNTIEIVRLVERRRGILKRETIIERKRIGSIAYPGSSKLVGIRKLKAVRKLCRLTEEEGVDSTSFYGGADPVDAFINEYRTVLRRLARR